MNSNSSREEVWSSQTLLLDLDMEGAPLLFWICWRFVFGVFFVLFRFKGPTFFLFWWMPNKNKEIHSPEN